LRREYLSAYRGVTCSDWKYVIYRLVLGCVIAHKLLHSCMACHLPVQSQSLTVASQSFNDFARDTLMHASYDFCGLHNSIARVISICIASIALWAWSTETVDALRATRQRQALDDNVPAKPRMAIRCGRGEHHKASYGQPHIALRILKTDDSDD